MTKGMLIIISGPSGSGKGTVAKKLCEDDRYALSVSVTTRPKRAGDVEGKDYYFCSVAEFFEKLENNDLLETTLYVGNYYGTPRSYVEQKINEGKVVILEIEVNGALQVRMNEPEAVLVFLIPQSMSELRRRLMKRATENDDVIDDRLRRANEEIELIDKYDYLVVNDEIDNAVRTINHIVDAELHKPKRNHDIIRKFKEGNKHVKTVI